MATITKVRTFAQAMDALEHWRDERGGDIAHAIVEWTRDSFEGWDSGTAKDVLRHLEMTDCAACHAPRGLIYTRDIMRKAADWWPDIDEALAAYHDETGEHPRPRDGALTMGWLVWFAVEWIAHEAATFLACRMED